VPNHTDIPKGDKTPNFVLDIPTGVLLYASRGFFLGTLPPNLLFVNSCHWKKHPIAKSKHAWADL